MKKIIIVSTVAPLFFMLSSCASAEEEFELELRPGDYVEAHERTLQPQKIHEVCRNMKAGNRWHYRFSANGILSFNLHYHSDAEVLFPVEEHFTRSSEDTFIAEVDQTYCLMWSNKSDEAVTIKIQERFPESPKLKLDLP